MTTQAAREAEAMAILDGWRWREGGCLIGGYAVAAYGKPRYSRDLDIVLPTTRKKDTLNWLEAEGFRVRPPRKSHPVFRDAATLLRGDFSIDLMFGYVMDRETGVRIEENWVSSRVRRIRLDVLTGSTQTKVSVARPEALWVLKIVAGRDQDLSDLFVISGEPINRVEIREELARVNNPGLAEKLGRTLGKLSSSKIYSDALSTRTMGSRSNPANLRSWIRFQELMKSVLPA